MNEDKDRYSKEIVDKYLNESLTEGEEASASQ